jgi:hypothetical protein
MDDYMELLKPFITEKQIELKSIQPTHVKIFVDENLFK